VPKRLARDHGLPRRIGRIFRDEEELAASPHLSKDIQDALRRSTHLIIVCSPRARDSKWVNAEVDFFRSLGRSEKILTLLIEGEPATSFPPSLFEIRPSSAQERFLESEEPLAADVRPLPDERRRVRERMARLRLLATILGCKFDELRRREQERRIRTLGWIGSGLSATLASFIALAVLAIVALSRAESELVKNLIFQGANLAGQKPADAHLYFASAVRTAEASSLALLGRGAHPKIARLWLKRCCQFELPTIVWHSAAINSASLSADGNLVVTAGRDKAAQVWDAITGAPIGAAMQHADSVEHARFSNDMRRVVTASRDQTARVWDARTGLPVSPAVRHNDYVMWASFSPDGHCFVTAGADGIAQLWDATSGSAIGQAMHHEGSLHYASFSPDGTRILTTSDDGFARIWDARTNSQLGMAIELGPNYLARFSADGERILTIGTPRIWNAWTGQPVSPILGRELRGFDARFSSDGKLVVTASSDRTARIWSSETGMMIGSPFQHPIELRAAAFALNERELITVDANHVARVWDVATGELLALPVQHNSDVVALEPHPNGRQVLTASADGTARISFMNSPDLNARSFHHRAGITSIDFSTDGCRFLTAGGSWVQIWDSTGPVGAPLQHPAAVEKAIFSPDGSHILALTSGPDWKARLWDIAAGTTVWELPDEGDAISDAAFNEEGTVLVTGSLSGKFRLYSIQQRTRLDSPFELGTHPSSRPHQAIFAAGKHGQIIASSGPRMQIWDSSRRVFTSGPIDHPSIVQSISASPDGCCIATATTEYDSSARVWDIVTGKQKGLSMRQDGGIGTIHFSPNGKTLLTAAWNGVAQIWDASTGVPVTAAMQHLSAIVDARFSPDGGLVATASKDGTARIWDANTGEAVGLPLRHQKEVTAIAFSPSGEYLLTGGSDTSAKLWDLSELMASHDELVLRAEVMHVKSTEATGGIRRITRAEWLKKKEHFGKAEFGRPDQQTGRTPQIACLKSH